MTKRWFIVVLAVLMLPVSVRAARVDSVRVAASAMEREVKVVYIVPDKALAGEACPVLYLLHGHSGNERTWIEMKPEIVQTADERGMIIVCPDGNNSWYWDSPVRSDYRYETFISKDLVEYTDSHYATVRDRKARAITGLSMGGHGAMWNALRHKEVFGAAGSMSGGVDIRPFPNSWNMKDWLGEKGENPEIWESHTVITQLDTLKNGELAIIFDCGTSDFFFSVNKSLHEELLRRGIDHDFIVRPGAHNAPYWRNSLEYHILFFARYFAQ